MDNTNQFRDDIAALRRDIELLKRILMNEGKLTKWAKDALANARAESEDSYTDLADL